MRSLLAVAALLMLALGSVGCAYTTAVQGQQGKAYVVKHSLFGSSFWNCDASSGKPRCFKVQKQ